VHGRSYNEEPFSFAAFKLLLLPSTNHFQKIFPHLLELHFSSTAADSIAPSFSSTFFIELSPIFEECPL
jgi:hypothetical protein